MAIRPFLGFWGQKPQNAKTPSAAAPSNRRWTKHANICWYHQLGGCSYRSCSIGASGSASRSYLAVWPVLHAHSHKYAKTACQALLCDISKCDTHQTFPPCPGRMAVPTRSGSEAVCARGMDLHARLASERHRNGGQKGPIGALRDIYVTLGETSHMSHWSTS